MSQEWKYVPVEPTEEMVTAADKVFQQNGVTWANDDWFIDAFKAAIAAAPTQPSPAESDKEAVRNAALEEASDICKSFAGQNEDSMIADAAMSCAKRINALKSHPAQPSEPSSNIPWDNFPGYLIDNHEGDVISEELLQFALSGMLKHSSYTEPAQPSDTDLINWMESEAPTIAPRNIPMADTGDYDSEVVVFDSCMNPRDQKRLGSGKTYREAIKAAMQADREGS